MPHLHRTATILYIQGAKGRFGKLLGRQAEQFVLESIGPG
jgi:hypothetical protein